MNNKFMLWDFDGTLGYDEGMWSGTLAQIVQTHHPERNIERDDIRPFLKEGFPWQNHQVAHTHLRTADDWWRELQPIFVRAFQGIGLAEERAIELSGHVRAAYVNPVHWHLFDDVIPVLQALTAKGWKHAILSNHVPELSEIVEALGLSSSIEVIINSSLIGYEKPNPHFFCHALQRLGEPQTVWMVGDNFVADIQGAEAVGIPAILVRKQDERAARSCSDLHGVLEFVESAES